MANLKEVRTRISSVISTQQITKAMKLVSASKLRSAQNAIVQIRPYTNKLEEIISNVRASLEGDVEGSMKLAQVRTPKKVLIISLTSDKGLCGAFNSYLIKKASALVTEKYAEQNAAGNVTLMPIGRRGAEFFGRRDFKLDTRFVNIFGKLKFEDAADIIGEVIEQFIDGQYDVVEVVYSKFKNAVVQIHSNYQLLPLIGNEEEETEAVSNTATDYIFEPSKPEIIENLIPTYLKIQFFRFLLDNNASEHGARMTAMDSATENAGELLKRIETTIQQSTSSCNYQRDLRDCWRCCGIRWLNKICFNYKKGALLSALFLCCLFSIALHKNASISESQAKLAGEETIL